MEKATRNYNSNLQVEKKGYEWIEGLDKTCTELFYIKLSNIQNLKIQFRILHKWFSQSSLCF